MLHEKLSDLTPQAVDALYGIDSAQPSDTPTFLFLVGAPGAGKSSGHARAIEAGILAPGNYATINMDTLLESLLPFRAASAMAHFLKRRPATHDLTRFASISAYSTRKENLGLFKWYDEAHAALLEADPETVRTFNRVRQHFVPLAGQEAPERLLEINEAALDRAIHRQINIVYETTLSLTKAGRVNKVDAIMKLLKHTPYRVVFYHITGPAEEVAARIKARQEHQTPQDPHPYYRYLPSNPDKVAEFIKATADGFAAVRKQYAKAATFEEYENRMDPARMPAENRRTTTMRRRRIASAYAPRLLRSSNRVSTPSSSSNRLFRLSSSSEKRKTQRRSTVRDE
jgi:hypothetical protein